MEHKRPKWDKRISEHPRLTRDGRQPLPLLGTPPQKGMIALAKYGAHEVYLLLTKELPNKEYAAIIKQFDSAFLDAPEDLIEDEPVIIAEDCIWSLDVDIIKD